jgi:FkbM family methyltransferase
MALLTDSRRAPLASLRAKLRRRPPGGGVELAGPKLLGQLDEAYPDATFVEIGAHDGMMNDDLRWFILTRAWRGVMVEPAPHVFERLQRNYEAVEGVALENAAISDHDGRLPFYHLAAVDEPEREGLPPWYDAIGSLSRENVLAHRDFIPDIERRLVRTDVACMTFESLCEKHGLRELDVLVVDAEGHDWTILRAVDFELHRPRLVVYEHLHLAPAERAECRAHLEQRGYRTREEQFNTWCLHSQAGKRLHRGWRRLAWRVPGVSRSESSVVP